MVSHDHVTALYRQHRDSVWRYLHRLTGSRDAAEDLCQEVFLHVLRTASDFTPRGLDRAWLFAIARHTVQDARREAPPPSAPLDPPDGADLGRAPIQALRVSLREALDQLAPTDRELLLLREVAGLTHRELAASTGHTVASVKCRLGRIRHGLRRVVLRDPFRRHRAPREGRRHET